MEAFGKPICPLIIVNPLEEALWTRVRLSARPQEKNMEENIEFKKEVFKTLSSIAKTVFQLKEDVMIRVSQTENKLKELEEKINTIESKPCCKDSIEKI